jgi:hypothetical protein
MLDRRELTLKIACALVATLVLYRLGLAIVHINPLYRLSIPALPSLASSTNSSPSKPSNTNAIAKGIKAPTNSPAQASVHGNTNGVAGTNSLARATQSGGTGQPRLVQATNSIGRASNELAGASNSLARITNNLAQTTNLPRGLVKSGTNVVAATSSTGVQLPPGMPPGAVPGMSPGFPGMPPGGMPGMGMPAAPLPPEIQARIDRIIASEILAPIMHPMPTALMGIAGKDVFLRTSNGPTGLVKEGEELGGVKVLRVGVNRVLVEEQGQRKELTLFAGLGSESLLSAQNDSPK